MRARWKILGGAGLVGFGLSLFILGHSNVSRGDTSSSTGASTNPDPNFRDPEQPYSLGPAVISYDQLSGAEKAGVDRILEIEDTSQPPASYQAWSDAASTMAADAQVQLAARQVGLVNSDQDGVVP
jgi:hypothetical protein